MAIWYRASLANNIKSVFSGDGGLYTAARWNHLGRKVIYCSDSISLCTLEWLAHNGLSVSGFNYYRYSIEIPDKWISKFTLADLPKTWDATPATDVTRDFAEENLFSSIKILAIVLPSVLVPEECNLVINPLHGNFASLVKTVKILGKHSAPHRG
jgi:RES domain-containing protein